MKKLIPIAKGLAFMAAILVFSLNHVQAQKVKWVKFVSKRGNFQIMMPDTPELEASVLENSGGEAYKASVKIGSIVYFASHVEFDFDLGDPIEQAQVGLESFAEALGAEITSQGDWKTSKKTGKWAEMTNSESGLSAYYHVLIVGTVMYQFVIAAGDNEEISAKDKKKFAKSFKLN